MMQEEITQQDIEKIDPNQVGQGQLTEEQEIYKENVLDHYRNPHNKGPLEGATFSHTQKNPLCGDIVTMHIKIVDGKVSDVMFEGQGCAISQASASMMTEKVKGMTLEEVKNIKRNEILEMIGVPLGPVRMRCALLSLKTIIKGAEQC